MTIVLERSNRCRVGTTDPPACIGGRKRQAANGKALPKDLPPKATAHDYLELWNWDAIWSASIMSCTWWCARPARSEASPTAAISGHGGCASCSVAMLAASTAQVPLGCIFVQIRPS